MDIKNFIKKRVKKDNSRFLVHLIGVLTETKWFSLKTLTKYLKSNEYKIERISIRLISSIPTI